MQKVRRQINPKLKIEGILLTMTDSRTNYGQQIDNLIRGAYGSKIKVFDQTIPRSVRAAEISAVGKSIFQHDPKGKVAEAYRSLTKEVIEAIRTLFKLEEEHRGATAEEQQVLSQYVGWGGLADAFDPSKDSWAKEYAELKGLLSEDEYSAARSSTLNAHYTSPTVIRGIYDAVERMGFQSGNILEPSMAVIRCLHMKLVLAKPTKWRHLPWKQNGWGCARNPSLWCPTI